MINILGNRVLFCGKGGSGKSTILALVVHILRSKQYKLLVLNGDASNPKGLMRLIFQKEISSTPRPLIEFFGGFENVSCPIRNPQSLTRVGSKDSIAEKRINVEEELPPQYYIKEDGVYLFLAGVIEKYGQCDGPIEKVVRDFLVQGDWITLVDMKGGLEQFGRRTPDAMDIILCVLDPTFDSVFIAKKVAHFCREVKIDNFWFILNKIDSSESKSILMEELGDLKSKVLGTVIYDPDLPKRHLQGDLSLSKALYNDIEMVIRRLEVFSSCVEHGWDDL